MNREPMLYDASSILPIVREFRGKAADVLLEGSTLPLAYYEVGNALWRECFILKRVNEKEAEKILKTVLALLRAMDTSTSLNGEELGVETLNLAGKYKITYYDAAYLAEAKRSGKTLVTDDQKLAKTAEHIGVKTVSSVALTR